MRIGDRVEVILDTDNTQDRGEDEEISRYIGRTGVIAVIHTEPPTVGESEDDPLIFVRLDRRIQINGVRRRRDAFWTEELRVLRWTRMQWKIAPTRTA